MDEMTLDQRRAVAMANARMRAAEAEGQPISGDGKAAEQQAVVSSSRTGAQQLRQNDANLLAGAARGAGSIGATIIAPYDMAKDAFAGKGLSLESNRQRRADIDAGLQIMGAEPDSVMYKGGKLVGEIAGTAGAGGLVAKPLVGVAPRLAQSLASGGFRTGAPAATTLSGRAADIGMRTAGGAGAGLTMAGLTNPESAPSGAVIGAIAPPVLQGVGKLGHVMGEKAATKYAESLAKFSREAPKRETINAAVNAGYIIPPNMVNPTAKNAIIESFSGKQATSQIASVKNQDVTEILVRNSLGLADDAPLSKLALEQIRAVEGGAYKRVAALSDDAGKALEELKIARNEAQGWFNAYNRSASPLDLAKAKEFRKTANDMEILLESEAVRHGKSELIPELRAARKQIAKTYTVQRALNDGTGTVNARVIGRMFDKGLPLSDGLDDVGRFASAFPSIAQSSQQMGSPAAHNLRSMASLLMGGGATVAAGPVGLLAAGLPFAAGSASRGLMFSGGAQRSLSNQFAPRSPAAIAFAKALQDQKMQSLLANTAIVSSASR